MMHCLRVICWLSAGLCYFEVESILVFSCFFNFDDFELTDFGWCFPCGVLCRGFFEAFDLYNSDFFHRRWQSCQVVFCSASSLYVMCLVTCRFFCMTLLTWSCSFARSIFQCNVTSAVFFL